MFKLLHKEGIIHGLEAKNQSTQSEIKVVIEVYSIIFDQIGKNKFIFSFKLTDPPVY